MDQLITFGKRIKKYRLTKKESLQQVANAINVNHSYLSRLENGQRKPSYDILTKFISYYSLTGVDALELINLTGYTSPVMFSQNQASGFVTAGVGGFNASNPGPNLRNQPVSTPPREEVKLNMNNEQQQVVPQDQVQILVPPGTTVLYTDSCFVTDTPYGIVMDYAQTLGPTNQQTIVARLGMSVEHAEALVKVLSQKIIDSKLKAKQKKERVSKH